jgi:hypothetical protein
MSTVLGHGTWVRGYLKSGMKAAPPVEEGVRDGNIEAAAGGTAGDLAAVG